MATEISEAELKELEECLSPLLNLPIEVLRLPRSILAGFEPSQIGTIVGTLMDACIPQLSTLLPYNADLENVGLTKAEGILGDREGYPDYVHSSGKRLELKLAYVDPEGVAMKKPPTRREPSARLTQKVTVKNVEPARDALLVVAYQLRPLEDDQDIFSPTIIDLGVFSMIKCIRARDFRLLEGGGRWFGDYETPAILSRQGKARVAAGEPVDETGYGRKESEGYDFNEDTNFGKLMRIPHEPLHRFLSRIGAAFRTRGIYPEPWVITDAPTLIVGETDAQTQAETEPI
ncbi:MAG TPA: hypothetical protein VG898_07755 [Solirubrobacterales bacterium]|nr:hypothetical protein [Solirubrobacterales bacterium]